MNPVRSLMLAFALALALSDVAHAQSNPAGQYKLEVTQVSDSCEDAARLTEDSQLTVSRNAGMLVLQLPGMPAMSGKERKRGKFRVEGREATVRANGTVGKFAATGRFDARAVRMVLVAEYVKDGKTQCAQSWNITGKK